MVRNEETKWYRWCEMKRQKGIDGAKRGDKVVSMVRNEETKRYRWGETRRQNGINGAKRGDKMVSMVRNEETKWYQWCEMKSVSPHALSNSTQIIRAQTIVQRVL